MKQYTNYKGRLLGIQIMKLNLKILKNYEAQIL